MGRKGLWAHTHKCPPSCNSHLQPPCLSATSWRTLASLTLLVPARTHPKSLHQFIVATSIPKPVKQSLYHYHGIKHWNILGHSWCWLWRSMELNPDPTDWYQHQWWTSPPRWGRLDLNSSLHWSHQLSAITLHSHDKSCFSLWEGTLLPELLGWRTTNLIKWQLSYR